MSRAWIVYALMFAMLIGGMWIILTFGVAMRAPEDLSGDWTVRWQSAPPADAAPVSPMRISQSGRFFTIRLADRKPISFTLIRGWKGARDGRRLDMSLGGEVWTLRLSGDFKKIDPPIIEEAWVELTGPTKHVGIARRGLDAPTTQPAGLAHAR